jgi:hypothetical protein
MGLNLRTRIGSFLEESRGYPAKQFNFKQLIFLKPYSSIGRRKRNEW